MTLTKYGIVLKVAEEMPNLRQKDIMDVLQLSLDAIADSLVKGENVEIRNFGVFEVVTRRARVGRNPKSPKQTTVIPEHKAVRFREGKALKEQMEK